MANMYMNRVTLCRFVGADAKHSAIHGGKEIVRFSLATTKRYKDGNEWKDRTQWHDCAVYWSSVKFTDDALKKGSHLLIEGELSYRQYDRTIETDRMYGLPTIQKELGS
jgi:single-strand DNA-binding protein